MSEQLVIQSDRETLTKALLEVQALLLQIPVIHSTPWSLRARVRVQWLLLHLCNSHLSPTQATCIRQSLDGISAQLRREPRVRRLGSPSTPSSLLILP